MADLGAIGGGSTATLISFSPQRAALDGVLGPMSIRPCRLRCNFIKGKLTAAVVATDISLQAPIFAALPPIQATSGMYTALTLNPMGNPLDPATAPEIVWAYSHLAGATTVLVHRGKEDTVAKAWPSETEIIQALTAQDAVLGY